MELEVDAKNVWRSITEGEHDRSYGGNILRDIFAYCSGFSSFKCKFVARQCNRVADVLANSAKDFQLEIWLNLPPRFLVHVLLANAAIV